MGFQKSSISRGSASPQGFEAFGFSGLLNINALPQAIKDNELSMALNVYGDVDGGVEMRRGMSLYRTQFSTTAGLGIYRFFQEVVGGTPQTNPVKFTLGQSGGTLWNIETGLQIGSTNALGSSAKQWSVTRIYDPATAGGTDIMVICTGSGGPYLFDGTSISTPSAWAAQAGSALYCQVANGTLWFGGIKAQPASIVQMQLGAPQTWQQTYTTSYPVTGLSVLGAGSQSGLFFGMTQGVGITFGVNASDAYYQEIPHEDGVAAGLTCIAVDGLVYFLGNFNIYVFDGQNITPIGDNVRPWIICDPLQPEFPMNGNRQISFSFFYNDRVYFAYDSGNVGYCNTYLVWHLKQRGWTILNGPKLAGATLLSAPGDPLPIGCLTMSAITSQAYNWDVYNGSGPNGHNVDDAGVTISTSVLTKYFTLAGKGTQARLSGIAPELFIEQYSGNIIVGTDYGLTSFSQLLSSGSPANTLVWNSSNWNQAYWGSGESLGYFIQQIPVDDESNNGVNIAYSFAFGTFTNDTNPPYRFAGVSGEFTPEGRTYSAVS